jgi:hypothetical protein
MIGGVDKELLHHDQLGERPFPRDLKALELRHRGHDRYGITNVQADRWWVEDLDTVPWTATVLDEVAVGCHTGDDAVRAHELVVEWRILERRGGGLDLGDRSNDGVRKVTPCDRDVVDHGEGDARGAFHREDELSLIAGIGHVHGLDHLLPEGLAVHHHRGVVRAVTTCFRPPIKYPRANAHPSKYPEADVVQMTCRNIVRGCSDPLFTQQSQGDPHGLVPSMYRFRFFG